MKILFYTFPQGHLVSDIEFERTKKAFAKVGMDLYRDNQIEPIYADIVMVKGWSHSYKEIKEKVGNKPIVYYSIGAEWKTGNPDNEPIRELYEKATEVVHISEYCQRSHDAVFPDIFRMSDSEHIIIPACEPKLSKEYRQLGERLKLATTCIPRPVKRTDQLQELCAKFDIELVPAWGGVLDFSYYHDCDGYIHLSRKEGMPNTVLEAMSYGLPCIVTNYGGAREAVGDAGIIIKNDPEDCPWDPDNIEPVDEVLFKMAVDNFRENIKELQMKVRGRVLSELNDVIMANKFKRVFKQCV